MKKMLFMQNVQVAPQKSDKKSERKRRKRKKLRSRIFRWVFRGIEALWMLLQIVQYLWQIFK
ncbi:MAG: hypothetical protein NC081_10530 [Roseburia sp.]|nr:hypothetical protein [Roseburia sp.]